MKKQIFAALLFLFFCSFNILPVQALDKNEVEELSSINSDLKVLDDGQWCVAIPLMGLFCWDL